MDAETQARLDALDARFDRMEEFLVRHFQRIEEKLSRHDQQLERVFVQLDQVDQRLDFRLTEVSHVLREVEAQLFTLTERVEGLSADMRQRLRVVNE